ncbi:MAG TPA: RNA polymerase sigma factor SigM [Nocardioides sp.]|uniref:RNA polymerase sigma factor SigM n=1 Tax=Nocardioides sp. TaxID=35761 RepID=UPI002F408B50
MTDHHVARPDDQPTDAELLAAHVAGDVDAFGRLFARHRDRLWAVALRTMGNPHDAADGLQDGLMAAYRRAESFRGEAAVTTWLHRVVVNACLDRIRAAKVRRTETLPDDLDEGGGRGSPVTAGDGRDDPEQAAIGDERRRALLAALGTLPAEQRAALVLVDMEGYAVAEVAVMLDCAEGTVKSRCARGRERLATLLRDRLGESPGDRTGARRDRSHPEPDVGAARPIAVPPDPTHAGEGGVP